MNEAGDLVGLAQSCYLQQCLEQYLPQKHSLNEQAGDTEPSLLSHSLLLLSFQGFGLRPSSGQMTDRVARVPASWNSLDLHGNGSGSSSSPVLK